eukprot:CAMPEP_0196130382 /NCGR_PEP_ID=MMETSP0910-20130528/775_1 /TAXON_ID=49265 /ORGANISM="Thalassiosira rotula, Strain GSO102" /LENGTH=190 /DNA_ID=CAMNT_0041389677 /DNA_START=118 /DNA_END=690 /DNA_ORIENTATION=+
MKASVAFRCAVALLQFCTILTFVNAFTTNNVRGGIRPLHPPISILQRQSTAIITTTASTTTTTTTTTTRLMAQITEKEATTAIATVVKTLQKDKAALSELGRLTKTNNILGYGMPRPGIIAVRFNASFQKGGMGRSSIPLPFGLGQSEEKEGRGTMVGQVKASVDGKTGKVLAASVFRDLGYGRSFDLKV